MRARLEFHGVAVAAALAALSPGGCADGLESPGAMATMPIIGGNADPGSPAVVMLSTASATCSGTLIGPHTVLTAGHCVADSIAADDHTGVVEFGSGGGDGFTDWRVTAQFALHRYYSSALSHDLALVRLSEPAPTGIDPVGVNLEPLPDSFVGTTVRVVGFGVTDAETQTGLGTKRTITVEVAAMGSHHLEYGSPGHNICNGDSGGPTLLNDFPNGEIVVAVSSWVWARCDDASVVTRTDAEADWLIEVFDAFDGPCALDGECVSDGCRTPDPDCDPCGFDGVCAADCPRVDLDCPVGGFAGDRCETADDCESRTCVVAPDDARISYCSSACEPAGAARDECEAPLSVCADAGAGGHFCYFDGPSPGAQGASCDASDDCRSGVCDGDYAICVEPCGDGLPACGPDYACESIGGVKVCTLPRAGGCAAGGRGGAGGALLLALALLAASSRRAARRGQRRRPGR